MFYNIFNIRYLPKLLTKEKGLILFLLIILTQSFLVSLIFGNNIFINIIDSLGTLFLGINIYFALLINYYLKKNDYVKDIKLLTVSYFLSFFYGLIRLISFNLSITPIENIFLTIEKRPYPRLAFSFTEPSFISMHVFGILFLLYLILKRERLKKQILLLIVLFSVLTILNFASARFLLDFLVIFFITLVYFIIKRKISFTRKIILVCVLIFFLSFGIYLINSNPRLARIVEKGVYADASLASRYFRVNASLKGYLEAPFRTYIGAGLGNAYIFLNLGYDEAFEEYQNSYMNEVRGLYNTTHNQFFSMPIRLISEFGIFVFLIVIIYFIYIAKNSEVNNKYLVLLVFFYLYIQFDSYAFYTMWLVLFIFKYYQYLKSFQSNKLNKKNYIS